MRTTSLDFARLAQSLSQAARLRGLVAPAFSSPPRQSDLDRSIRRTASTTLIAVRLAGRAPHTVAADMIEGVVVANELTGPRADRVRSALWLAVDEHAPGRTEQGGTNVHNEAREQAHGAIRNRPHEATRRSRRLAAA